MADSNLHSGYPATVMSSRKREIEGYLGDLQCIVLKKAKASRLRSKSSKRRHRGKRKSRKESRRRVRPGKSRSGFPPMTIGAPFNNNDFLISQRNLEGDEIEGKAFGNDCATRHASTSPQNTSVVNVNLPKNELTCLYQKVGCWRTEADHLPATTEMMSPMCVPEQSDRSAETSDYSSLNSPIYSSRCSNSATGDDAGSVNYNSDEIFDEEFELRNFEAEYMAHQQEMREELMKIPRRELEDRYFSLLDQTRALEEKKEESRKMEELVHQIRDLAEENRQLKLAVLHSGSASGSQLVPASV